MRVNRNQNRIARWATAALLLVAGWTTVLSAQVGGLVAGDHVTAEVLYDSSGNLHPDRVLSAIGRFAPPRGGIVAAGPRYVWLRTRLVNRSDQPAAFTIRYPSAVDTAWVYVPEPSGRLGLRYREHAARIDTASVVPSYRFQLPAGAYQPVFLRFRLTHSLPDTEVARLVIESPDGVAALVYSLWSAFYIGLLICMGLLSLIMLRLFDERSFLYFALLMLSFVVYTLSAGFILDALERDVLGDPYFLVIPTAMGAVVVAFTEFTIHFLHLRHNPSWAVVRIRQLMWGTLAGMFLPWAVAPTLRGAVWGTHLVVFVWILLALWILFRLRRARHEEVQRYLLAVACVAVPAVADMVYVILTARSDLVMQVGVQLGSVAFSGLLLAGLYTQVKTLRAETAALAEASRLRTRFFANISHEFRTPLTLIMSPLERLLEREDNDPDREELLRIAHRHAGRQLELVNRMLKLSRLEAREDVLEARTTDLGSLARAVVDGFRPAAEARGVALSLSQAGEAYWPRVDPVKVNDILFNLLSNSLKHTPGGGRVGVHLLYTVEEVRLTISDTGCGIPASQLPYVFQRFFRAEPGDAPGADSTGIGLAIVRELVELHGGTVSVSSEVDNGTTFEVSLPVIPAEKLNPEVATGQHSPGDEVKVEVLHEGNSDDRANRAHLLIVEDNAELCALLRLLLADRYRITVATDGVEALQLARRGAPDLVLSDVMMPRMDGFALCAALKSGLETSHVPVVLLTARGEVDQRIQGLQTGADAYLTKPFNDRELHSQIESLLHGRRLLRQRYATSIALRPSEVAATDVDQQFLTVALQIVEDSLEDADFKVADFAREVGMSTASLNRKLRALLDQSTNQFVQSVRLQRGAELLTAGELTVAEVAERTGFTSSTYFVRLFKEKHGVTPGAYQRDHTASE